MAVPNIDDIREYNPWIEGKKFEVPEFKRPIFQSVYDTADKRKFITAITGLRRVGKTVLLKQIGNEMQGERFFFSFEEDAFANYASLKSVVETFLKMGEKPAIFLDEIGRIKGWAGLLKKFHDLGKATFVVSGSSSIEINKGKESLAGRIMEFYLSPWSFSEFLNIKKVAIPKVDFGNLEKAYLKWKPQREFLREYLQKGGFPELHDVGEQELIKKYIKSTTVDKIVFEDLPKTFPIEHVDKLYDLMRYIAREPGNLTIASHVGEALELSKDTVRKYLFYLKYAYLIDILPVEGSTLKSFKKPKKVYVSTPAISYGMFPEIEEPRLAETCVYQKLRELTENVFFYRDPQKHEVDFTGNFAVEVKWKEKILKEDLNNLAYYLEKKKKKTGFLVNKSEFSKREINGKEIYLLPLDFFLGLQNPNGVKTQRVVFP